MFSLWRKARRENSAASRLLGSTSLRFALHGWQRRNWEELGGNDAPIELLVRKGKISGVGLTLRQLVWGNPDQEFKGTAEFPSSGPLEKAVVKNPNTIGISGISSASKRDVKLLALEGKVPNYENIKSGSSTFHMDFSMEPAGLAIM
ncbi:hypothetical protein [Thiolapillus sp.]|uniref:hypothetical protein n=1 Tax=Thiolapillus sp. TaxID=2017437 RepID=UPI003AF7F731